MKRIIAIIILVLITGVGCKKITPKSVTPPIAKVEIKKEVPRVVPKVTQPVVKPKFLTKLEYLNKLDALAVSLHMLVIKR